MPKNNPNAQKELILALQWRLRLLGKIKGTSSIRGSRDIIIIDFTTNAQAFAFAFGEMVTSFLTNKNRAVADGTKVTLIIDPQAMTQWLASLRQQSLSGFSLSFHKQAATIPLDKAKENFIAAVDVFKSDNASLTPDIVAFLDNNVVSKAMAATQVTDLKWSIFQFDWVKNTFCPDAKDSQATAFFESKNAIRREELTQWLDAYQKQRNFSWGYFRGQGGSPAVRGLQQLLKDNPKITAFSCLDIYHLIEGDLSQLDNNKTSGTKRLLNAILDRFDPPSPLAPVVGTTQAATSVQVLSIATGQQLNTDPNSVNQSIN